MHPGSARTHPHILRKESRIPTTQTSPHLEPLRPTPLLPAPRSHRPTASLSALGRACLQAAYPPTAVMSTGRCYRNAMASKGRDDTCGLGRGSVTGSVRERRRLRNPPRLSPTPAAAQLRRASFSPSPSQPRVEA
eukprot:2954051-Rhodomonas_salina.1